MGSPSKKGRLRVKIYRMRKKKIKSVKSEGGGKGGGAESYGYAVKPLGRTALRTTHSTC